MAASVQLFDARPQPLRLASDAERWDQLPQWAKDEALERKAQLQPALAKMERGISAKAAAKWLIATSAEGTLKSLPTLERWLAFVKAGDLAELAPKNKGRIRVEGGWEELAKAFYKLPGQPYASAISRKLQYEFGFADATVCRVSTFLKSLAAHDGEFHPDRIGAHNRRQNYTPHKFRDRTVLPVGMLYQGDGHALHYYVRHPVAGHHFTAELTPWMDIRSRYIAGWWLGEAESSVQVLFAMRDAIVKHDHVPPLWHVDPGSGNINHLMCDAVAGFVPKIGAEYMKAIAGNARGKGDIEGWFRWFEAFHGVFQPAFKGEKVSRDFLRNLTKRIEKGEIYVQSWDEALDGIRRYIVRYNETNQDGLGKQSPAKLWEGLQRDPLHVPPQVLMRPREIRMARSYDVQMFNRVYRAPALKAYEGRNVLVEYDLHDDRVVWIYDIKGRFVSDAIKVQDTPFLSDSRIRDLEIKRVQGQIKRLEHKADLKRAEAGFVTTVNDTLKGLESFGALELPALESDVEGLPPLDIFDTDY